MFRLIFSRKWAMPNKWTFTIKPIAELLRKYVKDGKGWIDPYAGKHSPAEITNDLNEQLNTKYHMDARDFCKQLEGKYDGVLFDPPYSYRQVSEHYAKAGIKATQLDTSTNFYNRTMDLIYKKIKTHGLAISFGWNSNGFGKKRGFKIIEIMLVPHGGRHNDTICIVEQKVQNTDILSYFP